MMNRSTTTLLTVMQRAMNAVSQSFGRADTQRVIRRGWPANTFGGTALRYALRGLIRTTLVFGIVSIPPTSFAAIGPVPTPIFWWYAEQTNNGFLCQREEIPTQEEAAQTLTECFLGIDPA